MDRSVKISEEQYQVIKKVAKEEQRSIKMVLKRAIDSSIKRGK